MSSYFTTVVNKIKIGYAPLPQDEVGLIDQDLESGGKDRSALQAKAKKCGIKANLPSADLVTYINLYEAGKSHEIPKDSIKKGKEGNFIMAHPKATGISAGCLFIILIVLVVIYPPASIRVGWISFPAWPEN
jgi:hypothetical protein